MDDRLILQCSNMVLFQNVVYHLLAAFAISTENYPHLTHLYALTSMPDREW